MPVTKRIQLFLIAAVAVCVLSLAVGVSSAHAATFTNPTSDEVTIYAGKGITLKATPGVYHGSGCTNHLEFLVYDKDGKVLERQSFTYDSIYAEIEWAPLTLFSTGTYTVAARTWYERYDIWPSYEGETRITITVDTASAFKEKTPEVEGFFRYANGAKTDLTAGNIKGADGYIVYRSTNKTSGFKQADKLKQNSGGFEWFTDEGLSADQTYYYKIRGFLTIGKKTYYTKYSPVVTSKKILAAPTFKSVSNESSKLTFTWGKVKGASGYMILMSNKSGGIFDMYVKKASAKKSSCKVDLSWLESGTYYFQIAAYTKSGTGETLGMVSKTKRMRIKNKASLSTSSTSKTTASDLTAAAVAS